MPLTPTVAIHMTAALGALVTGPVALWARRGREQHPRLHRAFGYAGVTLMLATAFSALFIRDTHFPNIAGYTPIHLFVPFTVGSLVVAFRALARRDIAAHRQTMQRLYLGACVLAGAFTLLPNRYLGHLVVEQWLGFDAPARSRLGVMAGQIVSHTPLSVWVLLAALLVLGLSQVRERRVTARRATILPLAMMALSLWGTASLFSAGPHLRLALVAWLAGAAAMFSTLGRMSPPAGAAFEATTRTFVLPGSWAPLALILGVFLLRYASNVALAIHHELAADTLFAAVTALASGLFTGAFGGRSARLWQLLPDRRPMLARLSA